ncbi:MULTISPECIES: SdrD B-like domain-containing protein [Pirellulaceae]|nr:MULTISPECIES: SdrD B-like domain-containing protein [Pirellulaceae]
MLAGDVASPWHNEFMPTDVNSDGVLDQQDIEILVGELKSMKSGALAAQNSLLEGEQSLYLDVDNDGKLTQRDLLSAMDALTLEGEPVVAPSDYRADYDVEIVHDSATTSEGGSKNVNLNDTFTLNIYVTDVSEIQSGFSQAFVDITFDSTKLTIDDPSTAVVTGPGFSSQTGDVPSNVTPYGGKNANDNQFVEAGKLKWMGGIYPFAPQNGMQRFLLASVTFRAVAEGTVDFTVDVRPYTLIDQLTDNPDPDATEVAFNQIERDGQPTSNVEENLAATYVYDQGASGEQLVRFDGGTVSVVIEAQPVAGANFDSYNVNEDYFGDDENSTPPAVTIGGVQYYVLDVLANDLDSANNPVTGDRSRFNIDSITQPTNGTVTIQTNAQSIPEIVATGITSHQVLLYQVPANLGGVTETFNYTTTDSGSPNNTGTTNADVVVAIANVDDAPIAGDASFTLNEGETVSGFALDYASLQGGPDETETLTFVEFIIPANLQGTFTPILDVNDNPTGEFTYTSAIPGLTESVQYVVSDGGDQTATGTLTFNTLLDSLIEGVVYFDSDNDGVVDENLDNAASAESRIGGVTLELVNSSTGAVIATTRTDAFGTYSFAGFDEGTYSVRVVDPRFTRKGKTTAGDFTITGNEISGITIGNGQAGQYSGLNFGYRGRDYAYISWGDTMASTTEDSITLAFSKSGGTATLEWYNVDEGWDRLTNINSDYIYLDPVTKSMQVAFEVTVDGQAESQYVVQAYSPSTPGYVVVAETAEGIIIRINGTGSQVMTNLAAVDAAFANL